MNRYSYAWFLSVLTCLSVSCSGEEEHYYPSVKSEFLTGFSGADGTLQSVQTDAGTTYQILENATKTTIPADSLIRMVGSYTEATGTDGTTGVKLYGWIVAVSPFPVSPDRFKEGVKTDPADVQSIWPGLGYINIILTVKMQKALHLFHFIEDDVHVDKESGRCDVFLRLYHDAKNDVQAFTKRIYLSVPLHRYVAAEGMKQVTIHFSLNTTSGELKTYSLNYTPPNM
ncbi:NigD-like protein [Bacteroides zoogleoformans]|uniref:NigD-like C-terminal domain-containing protein n=1 Tax=Bacteroides zoogleoformans TaxID=28119 RepID=A0ABN5IJ94_9BACE|nr:NigD-like C-terminal domain-containing protein [Bacteroides zoogleoformans]AVM52874.1 hypothetical protein C4H11_07935 [Bacteroides zoogleoformans]TWJ18598.1 NigD-like protein [Bacteroides zoogleoformans]